MSEPQPQYDAGATAAIVTGDALDLIPTLEYGSVNLVVTSPPYPGQYGNGMTMQQYMSFTYSWTTLLMARLAANAVVVITVQFKRTERGWFNRDVFSMSGYAWMPYGWNLLDTYIYGKANPPPNGPLTFCDPPGWEFIYVLTNAERPQDVTFNPVRKPYGRGSIRASNGKRYSNRSRQQTDPHPDGARQTTLMMMSMSGDQNRPRAKGISFPRQLPDRFIRQYTNPGDLVVDPFCGVGTTIRMAQELGRRAIGFERDADEAEKARAWLAESPRVAPPIEMEVSTDDQTAA